MNREIKYKAWDKKNKKIADVLCIDWLNNTVDLTFGKIEREFSDIILMQYSGLNDKYGIAIYEGYKIKNTNGRIYAVTFANGTFGCEESITIDYRTQEKLKQHKPLSYYVWDGCEVVGNIHEDLEFIGGEII